MGVVERDRGTIYCSVLSFGSGGEFLGKHCKLIPTASERLVWGFGDGSTLPVFDTPIGRVGTSNKGLDLLQAFYLSPSKEWWCSMNPGSSTGKYQEVGILRRYWVLLCAHSRCQGHMASFNDPHCFRRWLFCSVCQPILQVAGLSSCTWICCWWHGRRGAFSWRCCMCRWQRYHISFRHYSCWFKLWRWRAYNCRSW